MSSTETMVNSVNCTLTLKEYPDFSCDLDIIQTRVGKGVWGRIYKPGSRLKLQNKAGKWLVFGEFEQLHLNGGDDELFLVLFDVPFHFSNAIDCTTMLKGEGKFFDFTEVEYKMWVGCA